MLEIVRRVAYPASNLWNEESNRGSEAAGWLPS